MEITSESDIEIFSGKSVDKYNLQVTVAVAETERNEIEEESMRCVRLMASRFLVQNVTRCAN